MRVNGSPNKLPHRKLILNSGDVGMPKNNKIKAAKHKSYIIPNGDKFTAFK